MNEEKNTTKAGEHTDGYLFFPEASEFLGFKKSYLYKLTCEHKIPFIKYGGRRLLFDREELRQWMRSKMIPVKTKAEAEECAVRYCAMNPIKR